MFIIPAVIIGLAAIVTSQTVGRVDPDQQERTKLRTGDRPEWKTVGFDDSDWLGYRDWQIETGPFRGNLWLRETIHLGEDPRTNLFVLVATGSSEIFFDGELIGQNGVVGVSAATEEPGSLFYACTIPNHLLTPGPHRVAIRFSNHHGIGRFYFLGGGLGTISDVLAYTKRSLFPFLFLSAFLVATLYFLVLYFGNLEQASHLVFALMCGTTGLLLLVESIRALGYPYHWHGYRLVSVVMLSGLLAALVPLFFILHHAFSRGWLWGIPLSLGLGALLFQGSHDHLAFGFFVCAFLYTQILVSVAYWQQREDAWIGLLGVSQVLLAISLSGMWFLERWLFVCLTVLIVLIQISLSLQQQRQRTRFEETRLRSARLQIELLKKHLQPHFVLNTLTAVMEWLERDPKAGVAFIGLLAEEMKTLNRISGETLITLGEEIQLCRNHLEILAYRHEAPLPFRIDCDHLDLRIPPALILTLLENGTSYALDDDSLRFELVQLITEAGQIRLCFSVSGVDIHAGKADEGTGSKYIRARLEESFGDRWQLFASGHDRTWSTTITIEGLP